MPGAVDLAPRKKLYTGAVYGRVGGRARHESRESVQPIRLNGSFSERARHLAASSRKRSSVPFRLAARKNGTVVRRRPAAPRHGTQVPILLFRRSLTACGLALPADAFITWPTNQPIAFGLVLASATLSGCL